MDRKQTSKNASRGETLVETIVAFAVLMILLTMVTTAVRAAIGLNNHAIARASDTAAAAALVEEGAGKRVGTYDIKIESGPTDTAQIRIDVKQAGTDVTLRYFEAVD